MIADLAIQGEGGWGVEKLIQLFGYANCMTIVSSIQPPSQQRGEDSLIFNLSSNGDFSVKKAYNELNTHWRSTDGHQSKLWDFLWKYGNVQPRVRLFLWKLLKSAIPLAKVISDRIGRGPSDCCICGNEDEDVAHMLFHCTFARSCWFASPLPLRTHNLQGNLKQVFLDIAQRVTPEQWTSFANVAWAVWRCRNDLAHRGQRPCSERFQRYLGQISTQTLLVSAGQNTAPVRAVGSDPDPTQYVCFSDASWMNNWETGLGFILYQRDQLMVYRVTKTQATCPLHAEAKALLEAMQLALQMGYYSCSFRSDNKVLVEAVTLQHPPAEVDWRASKEIMQIWQILKQNREMVCIHVPRCHNELADYLAKWGRREGLNYTSFTFPMFRNQLM